MSVLFKIQARPRNEDSSDSCDSDYYPGRESSDEDVEELHRTRKQITNRTRRKRKSSKSSPCKRKLRKFTQGTDSDVITDSNHDGTQIHLPPEVLMKIFQYGVDTVGFINFIPRVAQVSKEWNRIASDPSMAHRINLGIAQVMFTRKNQSLLTNLLNHNISQCHHLSLNGQMHLGPSTVEHILNKTPRLRSLNLNGCALKPGIVKQIPQMCPLLQRIDLSSQGGSNRNFSLPSLKDLITSLGANLIELRLSNVTAVQQYSAQILKIIQESCPQLEQLDLGISGITIQNGLNLVINMEALNLGCPKLKELYLDGFIVLDKSLTQKRFVGTFANLQVYSQSMHSHYGRDQAVFYSLFRGVPKLKMLNISQSRLLPSLITNCVKEVDHLNLQDMKWNEQEEQEMVLCINAWSSSLRTLDLSYNKPNGRRIDEALLQFENSVEPHRYALQILNLSNTNVTSLGIIHVISACKNLQEINLTSCRELPRGTKREFRKDEFDFLLKSLHPFLQEND